MHVSDPEVTALPAPVAEAFDKSEQFVMEALPEPEQLLQMYGMMFFADGEQLSDHVAAPIFERATAILSAYQLPPEAVARMKPWAAFLTMSYPPEQARRANEALDLVLLAGAKQNGAEVAGLESLTEQADLFDQFTLPEQVRLLTDTVCHYELGQREFAGLKAFYLKQDLGALYRHSQRYTAAGEPLYKRLMQALLVDRNSRMAARMRPMLEQGTGSLQRQNPRFYYSDSRADHFRVAGSPIFPYSLTYRYGGKSDERRNHDPERGCGIPEAG